MDRWGRALLVVLAACGCSAAQPHPEAPGYPYAGQGPAAGSYDQASLGAGASPYAAAPAAQGPGASWPVAAPGAAASQAGGAESGDPSLGVESGEGDDDEEIDDGFEGHESDHGHASPSAQPPSPVAGLSDLALEERLQRDPSAFGSISVGSTNAGALVAGVQMPRGDRWELIDPGHAWGTKETVDALARSIDKVNEQFPGAPKLYIGHISAKAGGYLSPHVSHQSGRDVDISYYYLNGKKGFVRATAENLDREKTWAFVRALITETDVEMILIDTGVQRLLNEHASKSEDPAWLDSIFQARGKHARPLVRHAKGHGNHIHIRFYSPTAQEIGRRAHKLLAKVGHVKTTTGFVLHKARSGDTLGSLARRYGTSVDSIMQANGLRTNAIKAKKVYKIPKQGHVIVKPPTPSPVVIPPRRLPPAKTGDVAKAPSRG